MITIYLGAPRSGKSYLMRTHVRELARTAAPGIVILVVDHDDSWTEAEVPEGARYYDGDEGVVEYRSAEDLPRVAVFRGAPPLDVARLALEVGDAVYVDDEIDYALGDSRWKESPLREIVKRGRHVRAADGEVSAVSALVATHRPANLPTDVSGLFSRVYLGRLNSANDAERVYREGWLPEADSATECQRILAARRTGEFSYWPEEERDDRRDAEG